MSRDALARWLLLLGIPAFVLGIILCLQIDRLSDSDLGYDAVGVVVGATLILTTVGPVAALIGGVIRAWNAPLAYLPLRGVLTGFAAFLLAAMLKNSNVHDSRMVLVPGFWACSLGTVLVLLIAAVRFALSRRKHSSNANYPKS